MLDGRLIHHFYYTKLFVTCCCILCVDIPTCIDFNHLSIYVHYKKIKVSRINFFDDGLCEVADKFFGLKSLIAIKFGSILTIRGTWNQNSFSKDFIYILERGGFNSKSESNSIACIFFYT